jgi:hypothetical protein
MKIYKFQAIQHMCLPSNAAPLHPLLAVDWHLLASKT